MCSLLRTMGGALGLMEQRVLISDPVDASCVDILRKGGVGVDYKPTTSPEELLSIIPVSLPRFASA